MVFLNLTIESNVYLFTYMTLYNLSIISLFWTMFNLITTKLKTLHTFNNFNLEPFYLFNVTLILFSMAGVPPFIGFFSKLFIVFLLLNNLFFLFYFLFFILLLTSLYFYVQNIKFLYSTNSSSANYPFLKNDRRLISYYYFLCTLIYVYIFGVVYIDDFILGILWIFN